jgi:hypothetical protein
MARRVMFPQFAVGLIASTAVSVGMLEALHNRGYAGKEMHAPTRDDILSHIYNYVSHVGYLIFWPMS